jgi:hypothetical protein
MRWRPRSAYRALISGLVICLLPLVAILWSSWFAARHGCTLHEGFANPCIVNGRDWGEMLYSAFVSGWFMLLTLPVALGLLLALIILGLRDLIRHLRKTR